MLYLILAVLGGLLLTPLYNEFSFLFGTISGLFIALALSFRKRLKVIEATLTKLRQELELRQEQASVPDKLAIKLTHGEARAATINKTKEDPKRESKETPIAPEPRTVKVAQSLKATQKPLSIKSPTATTNPSLSIPVKATNKKPSKPATPAGIEKLLSLAYHWFTDGNTFVRIGIVVLFFGFAMLFKEAYEQGLVARYFPIELRLSFAALFSFGLLFFGWRFSKKQRTYGLLLQGAAIGLLYLTTFAALSLYSLIPTLLAFAIFTLLCAFSMSLAVIQNSKNLAIFSVVGGFLAPILTSTGSNNYIGLFSFYALLNSGILAVALKKSWRLLNLVGFSFTFAIASMWGGTGGYQAEFFTSTEPFLIFFFLLYVSVTVLFAIREQIKLNSYVDSSLLFGVPVLGFSLQAIMVDEMPYGLAISAFILGAFYIGLSYFLQNKYGKKLQLLTEAFLALGAIFATLSIPFALDSQLSSIAWVLEGAGIVWISLRQEQKYRRLFGLLIQLLGTLLFVDALYNYPTPDTQTIFNGLLLSGFLVMAGLVFSAWLLFKHSETIRRAEKALTPFLLAYGVLCFFASLFTNIKTDNLNIFNPSYLLAGSVFMLLIYTALAKSQQWKQAAFVGIWMIVPALLSLFYPSLEHPAQHAGIVLWPVFFIVLFYLLKQSREWLEQILSLSLHIASTVLIATLLAWEGIWVLLLGMTVLSSLFAWLSKKYNDEEMDILSLALPPAMGVSMLASVILSGNIINLPSIGLAELSINNIGVYLWPIAFAVAFALLNINRTLKEHPIVRYAHYFIGILIAISLALIGLGPLLLGASLLVVAFNLIGHRFHWVYLRELSQSLLPIMLGITVALAFSNDIHSFELAGFNVGLSTQFENGYLLWPISFIALAMTLNQWRKSDYTPPLLLASLISLVLLFVTLSTWEMAWHLLDSIKLSSAWLRSALPLFAVLSLWILMKWSHWPIKPYGFTLNNLAGIPIAISLILWSIWSLFSSGSSEPLPWLPIINPLDLMQLIVIFTLYQFSRSYKQKGSILSIAMENNHKTGLILLSAIAFVWLNIEVLRAISHWVHVPWQLPDIIQYPYSQTALAVLWTLLGIILTYISGRQQKRKLWLVGAGLLVVVVIKLFLFDFQAQSGVARVITFISVGVLLLLVGYLAPLPPAETELENKETA